MFSLITGKSVPHRAFGPNLQFHVGCAYGGLSVLKKTACFRPF